MAKARFDWDSAKDRANQLKHGVDFTTAQLAFADGNRVIAEDVEHSSTEKRYFCFGRVGAGVLTVRFTYRAGVIRIIGAGYWRKGKLIYDQKIKYTDEPIGNPRVIADFLPPPEDLAFREEGVKITLALSKKSVDFFKREAEKHNTQYQRMIRRLLDAYAERYAQPLTSRSTGRPPAATG